MFASKTPRDLNRDPKPYTHLTRGGRTSSTHGGTGYFRNVYDPRPKFDHVQHNKPNPILVKLREEEGPLSEQWTSGYTIDRPGRYPTTIEHYLLQISGAEYDPVLTQIGLGVKASHNQVVHARRVLTRLSKSRHEDAPARPPMEGETRAGAMESNSKGGTVSKSTCENCGMTEHYMGPTEVAAYVSRKYADRTPQTIRNLAASGKMPVPDGMIGTSSGWKAETIDAWWANRPGQGARTDLASKGTK